jgi:hypothetical protein
MKIVITTKSERNLLCDEPPTKQGHILEDWVRIFAKDYILQNLSSLAVQLISSDFHERVGKHIEFSDNTYKHTVLGFEIVDDDFKKITDVDSILCNLFKDSIYCVSLTEGGFRYPIARKEERYQQRNGCKVINTTNTQLQTEDGSWCTHNKGWELVLKAEKGLN